MSFELLRMGLAVSALMFVAACQTMSGQPVEVAAAEVARIEAPELRCPGGIVPSDEELAARINVSVERIQRLKRIRAVDNGDICRFSKFRLARSLERTHPAAPTFFAEALAWRGLAERDENGIVRLDGRTIASAQRQALVQRPDAHPSQDGNGTAPPPMAGIAFDRWTALGPGNIGGRVRSLVVHPSNNQKIWAGSVSGGIWVSSDAGASWSPVNDFLQNLKISCIAIDPSNSNVMYAGTGESVYVNLINTDLAHGVGIYKSTDGGASWTRLPSTDPTLDFSWAYVNRVTVHPTNGNIVLAATEFGIYRSADAGATWTRVDTARTRDIHFNPSDGSKAVGGTTSGTVRVSTNAGLSWGSVAVASGGERVETFYAPSSPNIVYASVNRNGGEVYKSSDGGLSWTLQSTPRHLSQGWYANTLWVAPNDANLVVVGGLDLYRSTNGGANFAKISTWQFAPISPHADHHAIVSDPGYNGTTNKRVYVTNDGGVYRTDDITTATSASSSNGWSNLNNGLAITQFYSGAGRTGAMLIGGTQDNGTLRYLRSGTGWVEFDGGDGGYVAVDSLDPNYGYSEYVYLTVHRTSNGGNSAQNICRGILDGYSDPNFGCAGATTAANFIAPFILDPNNNNVLLAGGASLWRSSNAKAVTPTWNAIKPPTGSLISAIAVRQGDSNLIWIGHNNGQIYKTTNGTNVSPTWTLASGGVLPARFASRILIDKDNPNTVYVTFGGFTSGNVWRTPDGGTSWTNIHGVLPQAPIRAITRHPAKPAWLYVGTEVGVFTSQDGGSTWFTTNDGPANVSVDELFWLDNATLVAATHGRGMFSTGSVSVSVLRDFDGDGRSDILWRNASSGDNYVYPMSGTTILAGEGYLRTVADLNWQVAGIGDFDGDGKADILWRNTATGENYVYLLNGTSIVGEGYIRTVADLSWQVAGIGDFDGDGKADILWRNAVTGENYLYPMDSLAIKGTEGYLRTVADTTWQIVGVGDFDGDGKSDILWRNSVSGQNYIYPMNGTTIKASEGFVRTVADPAWQVKGVGDFDGDGKADIVWRNSLSGENYLYPMVGTTIKPTEGYLRTVADLAWQIAAVGDYDGDGKSDLLWRNSSTGQNYLYPMDGTTIKPTEGFTRTVSDPLWQVLSR